MTDDRAIDAGLLPFEDAIQEMNADTRPQEARFGWAGTTAGLVVAVVTLTWLTCC